MTCSGCGNTNRAEARFCDGCGRPLAPHCPACAAECRPDARFCDACGTPLTAAARPADDAGARKVISIVFADLVGSTALHERLDAESARRFMERYYAAMRAAVEGYGGTVTQLLGDGVKALFGAPRVAEDDALRAVKAAVAMQGAFRSLAETERAAIGQTGLRVAVNTGEVVVAPGGEIIGDPVNVAARLQEQARDGDVVVGAATHRLVADVVTLTPLGTFALKGRTERVAAYRVESLERPAGTPATAFVGREEELRRLTAVYDAAVAAPAGRLAVVLGSPGLGKSRLLHELGRRLGDRATVLTARLSATGGATFAPLAEALRTFLGLDDAAGSDAIRAALAAHASRDETERTRVVAGVAALLSGTPVLPEETFFAVRRFLAALATRQPVVLVLDDVHWAEPLLLDLTEHLVEWSAGVPLLIVAAARPELHEARATLTTVSGLVHDVVTLGGLDAGAAMRLAANVIGADELPAVVAGRVLATSEGNPLFVSELVRMLVHDGALKREGDRWTTGTALAELEMPPTIHALLAARIERLPADERLVLERASIVGRQFSRAAVAHLLPREIANLPSKLEALRRSELIESDTGWFLGEPVLRFHHVLVRDAAYRHLLKETRAELHARFADWLEARVGDAIEHDETIGWHLEQAHRHLRELGPLDDAGRTLGERAARYLGAAGRRALARDDVPLASGLLGRALARLDADDPARADLALDWCEALLAAGDVGPAAAAIDELGRFTSGSERLRAWHTCFAGQRAALTDPESLHATAAAIAPAADTLATAGDAAGEAKAHFVHAIALARLGQVGACEGALDRALAAARRAHDRRRSNAVLAVAPLAALWGPSPVTRASGRCLDVVRVLRITQGAPAVEAVALRCQGVLEALRGRSEAARRMIASSRRMVEELGITQRLLEADMFAGLVELLEGDAGASERSLRAAYEGLRAQGLGIDAAQAAALLGRALLALERPDEAEAMSHESEALAGDDLQAAIAWRGVRAEALARRGEHASAVELARAAVDLAAATDSLLYHADARLALAAALRAGSRTDQAAAEEARAIELWEAKGATLLAQRARRDGQRVTEVILPAADQAEPSCRVRRRVRPNAATANMDRLVAALTARDADACASLFADQYENVHHPTGATYGREGSIASMQMVLANPTTTFTSETVATLGDTLGLFRVSVASSAIAARTDDVGAYEIEVVVLSEVDADGRRRRAEEFASDRLVDAVARLYERYAELLPDRPARTRAMATAHTARSYRTVLGTVDLDFYAAALDPAVEFVDHRPVGLPTTHGSAAYLRSLAALLDVADDIGSRLDDVLALDSDAVLVRVTNFGTERTGGGAWERPLIAIWTWGLDGRITRFEFFDPDRPDDALARFDALTTATLVRPTQRRVRPNAATAHTTRVDAAIAAGDADAFPAWYADEVEAVDHVTGTTLDRQTTLYSWRGLVGAPGSRCRHEPLATLGDSFALVRRWCSAGGFVAEGLDVGPFESEDFLLYEVDAAGRCSRTEKFAPDHLGDAVVRLYERYAETLPDEVERVRAVATARSLAGWSGALDFDRLASSLTSSFEIVDHRILGTWSSRGATVVQHWRAQFDVAGDMSAHDRDVLALTPAGFLSRRSWFGTDRVGGGPFENVNLALFAFGVDGLPTRVEVFDADREAEALARFDALTAEAPAAAESPALHPTRRRVRPNAATANADRFDAAVAARDIEALSVVFADDAQITEHQTGVTYDREGAIRSLRMFFRGEHAVYRHEPLATLGDSLALNHLSLSAHRTAGQTVDVAAWEAETFAVVEVDADGRRRLFETFASDRLGDGLTRLYERYAEILPEGPARTRAMATARAVAASRGSYYDLERRASAMAADLEVVDHRTLGTWSARGADAALAHHRSMLDVADDIVVRDHEILALQPDRLLVRRVHSGTDRASGGAYERPFIFLSIFGPDGLSTHAEYFDADRDTEALARFDELTAEAPAPAAAVGLRATAKRARRLRPNAATANIARINAAMVARDADALSDLVADTEETHHANGLTYGREGLLASWRSFLQFENSTYRHTALATLGDSLALSHLSVSGSGGAHEGFDVGFYESEKVALIEVDAHGRQVRTEVFATDQLGEAIVRLSERYAELLPDGPARTRAAATARSLGAAYAGPEDLDRMAATFSPFVEHIDHRIIGVEPSRGAEAVLRTLRSLHEVADDVSNRVDDILALRPDGHLLRVTNFGRDRASGGIYERPFLLLSLCGADGLLERLEQFDVGHEAEALARFDELTAKLATPCIENAATRTFERAFEASTSRDWQGFAALFGPGFRGLDRRRMLQGELDRDAWLASYRPIVEMTTSRSTRGVLATRGERLALTRYGWEGTNDLVGPSEIEYLMLIEVDGRGDPVLAVMFDPDDLDAAYAELDARYAAGEAAPYAGELDEFGRALATRDWDAFAARYADDLIVRDHRPLGWETLHGRAPFIASLRSLVELAPDARLRTDHMTMSERGFLSVFTWVGTRDGGPFEITKVAVTERDATGRIRSIETYELDQLDEARARFAALTAAPPVAPRIANAATRLLDRFMDAWNARDWERIAACFAAGFNAFDGRRMALFEFDRDAQLASLRLAFEASTRFTPLLLATRGERLALYRERAVFFFEDGGPSELHWLEIDEVDERGDNLTMVLFDPDDLDAAYAELNNRYFAGEAAPFADRPSHKFFNFFARPMAHKAAGDWDTVLAPDFVVHDHSPLGWGILDRGAYIESVNALVALAPDTRTRTDHLWLSERAALGIHLVLGTHQGGGTYEQPRITVHEIDTRGREGRRDIYSYDQLEEARARFAALNDARVIHDPLAALVRPNLATATRDRAAAAFAAGDWETMRTLCAPEATFDDRRRHTLVSTDADVWIDGLRESRRMGGRTERRLVSTVGDRVVLEHLLLTLGPSGGESEIEVLQLTEVDARGLILATLLFDVDDWRAALREAWTRWFAADAAAAAVMKRFFDACEGWNDHDLERAVADGTVVDDRRRVGLGVFEGGTDAYRKSLTALWDLVPDAQLEIRCVLAREAHGAVTAGRVFGTFPEGGPFENQLLLVHIVEGGRVARIELFEIEDVDAALARLAELRPDPLCIPPNAAVRGIDRSIELSLVGDWDGLRAALHPEMVYDDRRRLIRTIGGIDMFIEGNRFLNAHRARPTRTLLATAGEYLALERCLWTGDGGDSEVDLLGLAEVDAEGRCTTAVFFDPDDRRAAAVEMLERFTRSGTYPWMSTTAAMFRAFNDHDLDRFRSFLDDGFVFDDHRRTGVGCLAGADAYVASIRPLFEAAPDFFTDNLYYDAIATHGSLVIGRTSGTLAEGGEFESVFVRLFLTRGNRLIRIEQFELEDLDRARARFEELRPDPLRIPPNAVIRLQPLVEELRARRDWAALRALASDVFVYEDRRKRALLTGDADLWVKSFTFYADLERTHELIGTAGERIGLARQLMSGTSDGVAVEVEFLGLLEIDASGRLAAIILFDPEDRATAFAEMSARFAAGEGASIGGRTAIATWDRAFSEHDREALRESLASDITIRDHRPLGLFESVGRDAYMDSLRTLWELSADATGEPFRVLAWNGRGQVAAVRVVGTMRDGGAFESLLIRVFVTDGGRIRHFEGFPIDDAERAIARFEELCTELPSAAA